MDREAAVQMWREACGEYADDADLPPTGMMLEQFARAVEAAEREKLAGLMDAEADEQEAAWRAHLKSGSNASATSYHSVTRSWANRIREAERRS